MMAIRSLAGKSSKEAIAVPGEPVLTVFQSWLGAVPNLNFSAVKLRGRGFSSGARSPSPWPVGP